MVERFPASWREVIAAEAAGDGERDDTPRSPQAEGWLRREKEAIRACSRICRGDRARLDAREGSGALSVGQAWKMAARWHELVGMQERARVA